MQVSEINGKQFPHSSVCLNVCKKDKSDLLQNQFHKSICNCVVVIFPPKLHYLVSFSLALFCRKRSEIGSLQTQLSSSHGIFNIKHQLSLNEAEPRLSVLQFMNVCLRFNSLFYRQNGKRKISIPFAREMRLRWSKARKNLISLIKFHSK